jgi:hypothetical protein
MHIFTPIVYPVGIFNRAAPNLDSSKKSRSRRNADVLGSKASFTRSAETRLHAGRVEINKNNL